VPGGVLGHNPGFKPEGCGAVDFDFQSNTGDNLSFIQDLLFYMVDSGLATYRVPKNGVPIDFLTPPIRTTRFQKIEKVLNAYTEDTGVSDRWRIRLLDSQSGDEYSFEFSPDPGDAEFLVIDRRQPAG
jgi:hypothetical protein